MKNVFWIGYKGDDPLLQITSDHVPEIGDIIHYLCDGTEENYKFLEKTNNTELEGKIVSKWTSLSYKEVIWTVECFPKIKK